MYKHLQARIIQHNHMKTYINANKQYAVIQTQRNTHEQTYKHMLAAKLVGQKSCTC